MTQLLWSLLGIVAGALVAFQAPINAALGRDLGLPVAAACVSFIAGSIVLIIASVVMSRVGGVSLNFRAPAPWLFVAGGILGAIFVTTTVVLTPRLGAAALMAFLVSGQLVAGLFIDRIGLFGLAVREISVGRVAGAMLLLLGAMMIRFT